MYQMGDSKLEVRELLVKAFASAWEAGDKTVDRDTYINSSINVIDSLQVGPEMIYGEEGQGLLEGELDHLPDLMAFADKLEKATLDTIASGKMTKDLALITSLKDVTVLNSRDFILAIREKLEQ